MQLKFNSFPLQVTRDEILKIADMEAPRVGPKAITEGILLRAAQQMCPQHTVHHIVLFRGDAPLRKFMGIRRRFEDVTIEDSWEPWEKLTARQTRRPCASSRCGLTIR